jgi:hypothetical protein
MSAAYCMEEADPPIAKFAASRESAEKKDGGEPPCTSETG